MFLLFVVALLLQACSLLTHVLLQCRETAQKQAIAAKSLLTIRLVYCAGSVIVLGIALLQRDATLAVGQSCFAIGCLATFFPKLA